MEQATVVRPVEPSLQQDLLQRVTTAYLDSEAFHGCSVTQLQTELGLAIPTLREHLQAGIAAAQLTLVFGDLHPNPMIRALPDEPKGEQLRKLKTVPLDVACVYPSAARLEECVDPSRYEGRPFTLELARGKPQLAYQSFDLQVLERYRDNARYRYAASDIIGTIFSYGSVGENALQSERVLLKSFGFSHDPQGRRAVAVFLCYLARMPADDQQHWLSYRVDGEYRLNPDFYRTQITGDWPERLSIFDALLEEMHHVNTMAVLMGRKPLFGDVPRSLNKPSKLAFMLRPTQQEFHDFIVVLDKLLSDNINPNFFGDDLVQLARWLGVEVNEQWSGAQRLRLLEGWITNRFRAADPLPMQEMVATLREIQSLRYRPARDLDDVRFDSGLYQQQRALMKRAYTAVRVLRLVFENHPAVGEYQVSKYLNDGLIWTQ